MPWFVGISTTGIPLFESVKGPFSSKERAEDYKRLFIDEHPEEVNGLYVFEEPNSEK